MLQAQLLAEDYGWPLLNLFWTMMIFFLWIAWIFLLFRIIGDIFQSDDMGGGVKALWALFVIFLPFLGVFLYVIVRGKHMQQRDLQAAQAREQDFQAYVKQTAGSTTSSADEIAKLAALKDQGVLTDQEFAAQKAKLLS
jgi:hypothetical protein